MSNWEELEKNCYERILKMYGKLAQILAHGESDSTKPDIEVILPNGEKFFIEVKSRNAQCCQFVLFPDDATKTFCFSNRNKTEKTAACMKIIKHMEENYTHYHKPSQSGINIDIDTDTLYELVDEYYAAKLVKYFMTQDKDGNYIIFPSERFKNYFNITSCYRKKKSGSGEPREPQMHEIREALDDYFIKGTVDIVELDKPRCFLACDNNALHNEKLICTDFTYQLKRNKHSEKVNLNSSLPDTYEIRKLSNTNNPNVICQLELKDVQQNENDLKSFNDSFNIE